MKVSIIGGGNMGGAFAHAFVAKGVVRREELTIIEKRASRCEDLRRSLQCEVLSEMNPQVSESDVVVIAVKPQDMRSACGELKNFVKPAQAVISIMAGPTIALLSEQLGGHKSIVRAMPNLAATIGKGMTVFAAAPEVTDAQRKATAALFDAAGSSIMVEEESLIDAATAVSGSGPGFIFYLIEHFLEAAAELGFSEQDAKQMVAQTFEGSVALWSGSKHSASQLREQVTSKGGTTEAGLAEFETGKLGTTLVQGIKRACERCRELKS